MVGLRDRRVAVLLALVLLGSVVSVVLALTRPEAVSAGAPPALTDALGSGYRSADLPGPGGDALAAAVAALPATLSYDHRDLDGSLERATATMTKAYAAAFTRTFDRRVRPFATRRQTVAEGRVRGAGVVRTSGDDVVVCLLYVDQLLVGGRGVKEGADPRVLSRNRVRVALRLRDGAWLVADVRPV